MSPPAHRMAIVIAGGGPIGLACALLLQARGLPARVLESRALEAAQRDTRVLACSRGSWSILQPMLEGATLRRADIKDVYVSSAGEFGITHLPSRGEPLGATVVYGELVLALAHAAQAAGINVLRDVEVTAIRQHAAGVSIDCGTGETIEAPMAIVAEGSAPMPAGTQQAETSWALVAAVSLRGPAAGAAFERFTREGPLALLPAPSAPARSDARAMSLVWCMSAEQCARRLALSESECLEELQHAVGTRIGRVSGLGQRGKFRLAQAIEASIHQHRVVRLGNAAQTLHPVAGQGFNLGLRDCAVLADTLARHHAGAADAAETSRIDAALSDYAARRAADRKAIASLTAALPGLFASRFAPLAVARSAGLVALNLVPALRDPLAHLLMFGVRTA